MWGLRKSKTVIRMPSTEEDFLSVIGLYKRIGYPGCAGSIDCVHIVWDRCPADTAIQLWPLNVSAITRSAFYTFRKHSGDARMIKI